jgi:hypothetical protein
MTCTAYGTYAVPDPAEDEKMLDVRVDAIIAAHRTSQGSAALAGTCGAISLVMSQEQMYWTFPQAFLVSRRPDGAIAGGVRGSLCCFRRRLVGFAARGLACKAFGPRQAGVNAPRLPVSL